MLRKLRCLQIEVGIVQSLCRNDCHQVILLGQVFFLFVQYISYMRPVHIPKTKGVWKHTGKAGMQKHTRNKLKRVQHTKTTTATFNL